MAQVTSFREQAGQFQVVGLRSDAVELAVVPNLGAKIIRLEDRVAAREWTWSAKLTRALHRNEVGAPFEAGPLVGIDECIPTVAPCRIGDVTWPDHGEAWTRAWELDEAALAEAHIVTELLLKTCPLRLRRRITLSGRTVRIDYSLHHQGTVPQPYAWALHPLFAMRAGDRLDIHGCPSTGRVDSVAGLPGIEQDKSCIWPAPLPGVRLDAFNLGDEPASIKLYLPTSASVQASVVNDDDGSCLRCNYGPRARLPFLGIWITRGGWNGYHHFAIEPTNVDCDFADRIDPTGSPAAVIAPGEEREWFVEFQIGR